MSLSFFFSSVLIRSGISFCLPVLQDQPSWFNLHRRRLIRTNTATPRQPRMTRKVLKPQGIDSESCQRRREATEDEEGPDPFFCASRGVNRRDAS